MTTIAQVIAARGINEQHALIGHDRLKVWAGSGECLYGYSYRKEDIDRDDAALATLKTTTNIAEYVRAWCILNRLVL
jgi:hypothetical protein